MKPKSFAQPLSLPKPFRHEQKYYISATEYELLSRRLSLTMDRDAHARKSGKYFIRSLYFDDYLDSAFQDKQSGVEHRDKYRIRIYNLRDDVIRLERKRKTGSYIQKHSLPLSRGEADSLIKGDAFFLYQRKEPLAKELYAAFRLGHMKPKVLVDYWREAYVLPVEDVRVTFDMDLRTAYRATAIFDKRLPTYPAVEGYDMVMEIKFNDFLPGYIHTLVQPMQGAQRAAISKYCLCRGYE